jgi:hypothetical protein
MSEQDPSNFKKEEAWDRDIEETRRNPSLKGEGLLMNISEDLIREVDEFLAQGELQSKEEFERIISKLEVASAITGDPKAKEIREELLRRYS